MLDLPLAVNQAIILELVTTNSRCVQAISAGNMLEDILLLIIMT